jgi:PKD repeat protein
MNFVLPTDAALRQLSFTEDGLVFDGAPVALTKALYPQFYRNIAANGTAGDFTPSWGPGSMVPAAVGASLYGFAEVHDYDREKVLHLNWTASGSKDKVFVGMANWTRGTWDFYQCDATGAATLDEARWGDYTSKVLASQHITAVLVVILDNNPWTLASGRLGAPATGTPPVINGVSPLSGEEGTNLSITPDFSGVVDTWSWTFGGGIAPAVSPDEQPLLTLGGPGVVDCSVTAANAAGQDTFNFQITVNPAAEAPDITIVSPQSGATGDTTQAMAFYSGGSPTAWSWNFGAAATPSTSTEASPVIVLGAEGIYSCSVMASNSAGSDTFPFQIEVGPNNVAPVIIGVTPTSGAPGSNYSPFADATGGPIETWSWDFGGGATPNTSLDPVPSVMLGAPGTYAASVTATNSGGSDTYNFNLVVGSGVAAPDIVAITPDTGVTGTDVVFAPTNNGGPVDTWSWDFGGAGTAGDASIEFPTVTLGAAGPTQYTIHVTAQNAAGTSDFEITNFVITPF